MNKKTNFCNHLAHLGVCGTLLYYLAEGHLLSSCSINILSNKLRNTH